MYRNSQSRNKAAQNPAISENHRQVNRDVDDNSRKPGKLPEVLETARGRTQNKGHSFSQYGPTLAGE